MDLDQQKQIRDRFEKMYKEGFKPWTKHGFEPSLERFFGQLQERNKEAKILDLGCGDGGICIHAAKEGFETWGIDASATAIEHAKKTAIAEGVDKLTHFDVGDVLDLPYEDGFFDAVVDRGLFHHILPENRGLYFESVLRVFKPGGLMHLSVFSERNLEGIGELFTKEDIEKIFGQNFKTVFSSEDPYPSTAPAHLLHFILERSY